MRAEGGGRLERGTEIKVLSSDTRIGAKENENRELQAAPSVSQSLRSVSVHERTDKLALKDSVAVLTLFFLVGWSGCCCCTYTHHQVALPSTRSIDISERVARERERLAREEERRVESSQESALGLARA